MNIMKSKKFLLSLICGFTGILFYYIFAFISISLFPISFNLLEDLWSHLRWFNYNPGGAFFFRVGNILFGVFLIPYFIGWNKWYMDFPHYKTSIIIIQLVGFLFSAFIIINEIIADLNEIYNIFSGLSLILLLVIVVLPSVVLFKHPKFKKIFIILAAMTIFFNTYFAYLVLSDALIIHFRSIELVVVILNHGYLCAFAYNIMRINEK